ncbi:MAG: CDP-alcohol phosphatidyltransferase family protein [Solirubrobacterales bacterium]
MSEIAPFGKGRVRRLFGLDRSGPPPAQTRRGEPLRPFTLPNLVGYVRLAAIPVFLYVALDSGDGQSTAAALLFAAISLGDYLDGFLARVTGQYSRMGAILDPVVDRVTILSGALVCWHFELLPRWALAALAAREIVTLGLAQYGLRHGVDIEVNWPGRVAVFPIMGSIFLAMLIGGWIPDALLIVGLVLSVLATVLYARMGREAARARREAVQANPHSP